MKLISFNIGKDILEVHNNMWTGVETVTYNGYEVSRQFNWFRGDHDFAISTDDGNGTDYFRVVILMGMAGITVDVYRNEETLLAQSSEAKRRSSPNRARNARRSRVTNPEALYHEEDLV